MSRTGSYLGRLRVGVVLALVLRAAGSSFVVLAAAAPEGELRPEGNPFRGREIFVEKGCDRCHSVWGRGGRLGPEISVAVAGKTWAEVVGDFWNHTPRMIEEVAGRGYSWPSLDPREMGDLLSYLYYLRLFDEPGSPTRGAEAFARLQCSACHALAGRGGGLGAPLDGFGAYPSPMALAQAMWNAGPRMQPEQLGRGSVIPQFTGHEMADLQAYIRAEGRRKGREVRLQPLPSPARGASVYRDKGCGICHDAKTGHAPDITRSALSKTASEITGLLWNHSYAMGEQMAARNVSFPVFEGNQLADLIAHLYFRGYLGVEGDPSRGATVFREKGCADCHQAGVGGAPDLAGVLEQTDRAALASAMWNHAPQMHRLMAEKAPFWPKFEPGEMRNLVAYLRSLTRSPRKSASGTP